MGGGPLQEAHTTMEYRKVMQEIKKGVRQEDMTEIVVGKEKYTYPTALLNLIPYFAHILEVRVPGTILFVPWDSKKFDSLMDFVYYPKNEIEDIPTWQFFFKCPPVCEKFMEHIPESLRISVKCIQIKCEEMEFEYKYEVLASVSKYFKALYEHDTMAPVCTSILSRTEFVKLKYVLLLALYNEEFKTTCNDDAVNNIINKYAINIDPCNVCKATNKYCEHWKLCCIECKYPFRKQCPCKCDCGTSRKYENYRQTKVGRWMANCDECARVEYY